MQYTCINMSEHTVGQAAFIKGSTEIHDVICKILRWNCSVLDKWNRTFRALRISKQTYRTLTHTPDLIDLCCALSNGKTKALARLATHFRQMCAELFDLRVDLSLIITYVLNEVDTLNSWLTFICWEVVSHRIPSDILHRKVQNLRVDCFD